MLYNENRNDLLDETQRQEPVENTSKIYITDTFTKILF